MTRPNSTQIWAAVACIVILAAALFWFLRPAGAGERFAGLGVCVGEDPAFQCTPYFKPDRCNPAIGNWVNASDITCPPDAWNDRDDTVVKHKCDREDT